jgi:hypothetical protein
MITATQLLHSVVEPCVSSSVVSKHSRLSRCAPDAVVLAGAVITCDDIADCMAACCFPEHPRSMMLIMWDLVGASYNAVSDVVVGGPILWIWRHGGRNPMLARRMRDVAVISEGVGWLLMKRVFTTREVRTRSTLIQALVLI